MSHFIPLSGDLKKSQTFPLVANERQLVNSNWYGLFAVFAGAACGFNLCSLFTWRMV